MPPVTRRHFLAAAAAAPLAGCVPASVATAPRTETQAEAEPLPDVGTLPAAVAAFGCDLYANLRGTPGNVFFSPVSIETALAMTAAGARADTLAQMRTVLHLPAEPTAGFKSLLAILNGAGSPAGKRGFDLSVANALWGMTGYPWRPEFLAAIRDGFGGGLEQTDFGRPDEARARINAWVEGRTNNKIKDLIPPGVLTSLTRLVLTNAVYFKADWAAAFDKRHTTDGPFTRADGSTTKAKLMRRTGQTRYAETGDVQAVELPYVGGETAMTVLLPKAGGLGDFEKTLTADRVTAVGRAMRSERVDLTLPRFKTDTRYMLVDSLKALGMADAFDGRADFGGMHTTPDRLFVSAVVHKAFVAVDEEGTEAAAATGVVVTRAPAPPSHPKVFRADRPFVFLIRHVPTDTVLFLGRVGSP